MADSRKTQAVIDGLFVAAAAERVTHQLRSPRVGWFRPAISVGALLAPGLLLGTLETLGATVAVLAPASAHGVVRSVAGNRHARFAVGFQDPLFTVDVHAGAGAGDAASAAAGAALAVAGASDADGLVFRAPTSGRFYLRAAPGKPAFVAVGDVIATGTAICLLEVMKTFHRVAYGGEGLPARAVVVAIVAVEEGDINAGDVLLRLSPA
jgi:acetyl-CoA carboxylase biotin carboxyl carrier protein